MISPDHRQAISKLAQLLAGYDEPLNRHLWMSAVPEAWREAEAPGDGPVTEVEGSTVATEVPTTTTGVITSTPTSNGS